MKSISNNKFKKQCRIFNLKTILNDANNESYLLISKITELQKIFKNTKKIINEKINELSKMQKNKMNISEAQLKQQICIKLNKIIKKYKKGKTIISINSKTEEYKKLISEKTNDLNLMLKKLKYKKLQSEKDLLIQTIKEKKNICEAIQKQIEYEKNLSSIFHPKNYIFFDNLYNINNQCLKTNIKKKKKKKFKELLENTKMELKDIGITSVYDLKRDKSDYFEKFNKYINDKGFNCSFENKRYNEKYNLEIELISDYGFSSDSEYDIDEEESNNKIIFLNNNIYKDKNNGLTANNKIKNNKISLSSSEKETNDQEKETKKDNIILERKLVEIKEKYNKLINERFDLDYQQTIIEKKITNIKYKMERNAFSCSSLSIKKGKKFYKEKNKKNYFSQNL